MVTVVTVFHKHLMTKVEGHIFAYHCSNNMYPDPNQNVVTWPIPVSMFISKLIDSIEAAPVPKSARLQYLHNGLGDILHFGQNRAATCQERNG